jgi:hypothetical protein
MVMLEASGLISEGHASACPTRAEAHPSVARVDLSVRGYPSNHPPLLIRRWMLNV